MEVTGRIKLIGNLQVIGGGSFKKRELVVTTEEQYPQHILIEFTQDRCDLLDAVKPGDMVKVSISLRGREWVNPQGEVKYFNSINGWKIEQIKLQEVVAPASSMEGHPAMPPTATYQPNVEPVATYEEEDDLPF